ncbi:MAG: CoA transferase subunit A [Myxococcota bacterium]
MRSTTNGNKPSLGRHRNKVRPTVQDALEGISDGARIMVGGFGLCGNPEALIRGVVDAGVRHLHLMSNNAGNLGKGLARWIDAGIVSKITLSYIGTNQRLHDAMADGSVEVEVIPQGTFVERMRAAGSGIPAFYTPTGVGTLVAQGKECREFAGRSYLLEHALHADLALIRAAEADSFGNARFYRTARNFSPVMATAATTTILEADRLRPLGALGPDDIHLPGVFVHRIVEVSEHEDPFEYKKERSRDESARSGGADALDS